MTTMPITVVNTATPMKIVVGPRSPTAASPMSPATLLPSPVAAKYAPIISAAYFTGASLVTKESATGEAQSSPIVWKRYASTSQPIQAFSPASTCMDAATMKRKPQPMIMVPMAILKSDESSRRRPQTIQKFATGTARRMM